MLRLKNILTLLSEINDASKAVMKRSLEVVNKIPTYTEDVLYTYPELNRADVVDKMTMISSEWTETAESVNKELPDLFIEGDDTIGINFDRSPFFSEIWNGDTYGKSDIEGLMMLKKELFTNLQQINHKLLYAPFRK
jgi:hypothetical protein